MLAISIDKQLKDATSQLALGVVQAQVRVSQHDDSLWKEVDDCTKKLLSKITLETIGDIPEIKALRDAYKAIGKDPLRYRGSAEALVRRILQGKELYKVNTVVDINNLVSLETLHSVGSYDLSNLKPPIVFRIGAQGESYKGIGKEIINIAELPVFVDAIGPYGSPTSDSERAMITNDTTELLMVIISFTGRQNLEVWLDRAKGLLQKYAMANSEGTEVAIIDP